MQGWDGPVVIEAVATFEAPQPVYNLEVHGEHVYHAGELGLLVHNTTEEDCLVIVPFSGRDGKIVEYEQPKGVAPNKVPTPSVKGIGKVADVVPKHVPKNWSKVDIENAISTYEKSIRLRKAEAEAFDAVGGGHVWARKAHYERIVQEENFLRQLRRTFEDLR